VIDVPSGRVTARVRCARGTVEEIAFVNVPASVTARGVDAGEVKADVAWGGAFYAFVPAAAFGLRVMPEDLPALIVAGRAVKAALDGASVSRHPDDDRLSGIYGTVLTEPVGPAPPPQRGDLRRRRGRPLADGVGDVGADRVAAGRRRDRHRQHLAQRLDRRNELPRPANR